MTLYRKKYFCFMSCRYLESKDLWWSVEVGKRVFRHTYVIQFKSITLILSPLSVEFIWDRHLGLGKFFQHINKCPDAW